MGCVDCSSSDLSQEFHVLAVDDSLVDRKVIEKLFKISSCKVTAVESGSRALQYLGLDCDLNDASNSVGSYEGVKLNLIVTDYSMPGMTGFELLQKIKGSKALREIPVVVMSSENVLARIDRCLEEGAEEFLVKPVKLSDVKRLRDFVLKGKMKKTNKEIKQTCHKRKSQQLDDEDSCIESQSSSLDFDADLVQERSRSKRVRLFDLDSSETSIH